MSESVVQVLLELWSVLRSCAVLRVSDSAKEPGFGIGILSQHVLPVFALRVPMCPLNFSNSCAFKKNCRIML